VSDTPGRRWQEVPHTHIHSCHIYARSQKILFELHWPTPAGRCNVHVSQRPPRGMLEWVVATAHDTNSLWKLFCVNKHTELLLKTHLAAVDCRSNPRSGASQGLEATVGLDGFRTQGSTDGKGWTAVYSRTELLCCIKYQASVFMSQIASPVLTLIVTTASNACVRVTRHRSLNETHGALHVSYALLQRLDQHSMARWAWSTHLHAYQANVHWPMHPEHPLAAQLPRVPIQPPSTWSPGRQCL
jgi:hypothetical protein